MILDEYTKDSVQEFKGLYARGSYDVTPKGHATDLLNVTFSNSGEVQTRGKLKDSVNLGHPVQRLFMATFGNSELIPLACDGADHIYRMDTGAIVLTVVNMIDFAAINIFNKVFICPILSAYSSTNYMKIWTASSAVMRDALGFAPGGGMAGANSATVGNIAAGVHKFAVAYVTDSGFYTQPGPKVAGVFTSVDVTAAGGVSIDLTGIPTGPAGTTARLILATKSDLSDFYFLSTIQDNTTTTLTVDFRDTDLAQSADYLFDVREYILGGVSYGSMMLQQYHSSLLIAGAEADLIRVSNQGDAETFDDVIGYIQLPSEFDGNIVRAACVLFDTLYFTKSVGIYSVQDNESGDPSTWKPIQIDGGAGCYHHGLSTITASQGALSSNSQFLIANREGAFIFNGTLKRPQLSWKIQSLWDRITFGSEPYITVAQDAFKDVFYFNVCLDGSATPNTIFAMDFSDGLSADAVAWSVYSFPVSPVSMGMLNFNDGDDGNYYLRIGAGNKLYKLTDEVGDDLETTAIDSYYQTHMVGSEQMSVFHSVGIAVSGDGSLVSTLRDRNGTVLQALANTTLSDPDDRDYVRKSNVVKERVCVRFGTNASEAWFKLKRADIYHKAHYQQRPA